MYDAVGPSKGVSSPSIYVATYVRLFRYIVKFPVLEAQVDRYVVVLEDKRAFYAGLL